MAHDYITCPANEWTQLTNDDVTALRVQNTGPNTVLLQATAGATAPADLDGGIKLGGGQILLPDTTLENLFPGVAGAARVWAYPVCFEVILSVSHA
ncbi:hypothetical protein [Citreimonas sp.]|uniref:hypothetical protein n=1 Tax=Citreimonas sp. TaxID=3036715 RepID=UPI0040596452